MNGGNFHTTGVCFSTGQHDIAGLAGREADARGVEVAAVHGLGVLDNQHVGAASAFRFCD